MKAIVILNPHAHSDQPPMQIQAIRDEVTEQLRQALRLDSVEWVQTQHAGHGKELAEKAAQDGYEMVFAGGGDGTINEVLNGIMGLKLEPKQRPILGVLPFGTSNDFFAGLKTAETAHKVDDKNNQDNKGNAIMNLDVGHVLFDNVERYFCLTTGMGLFSWANEQYLEQSRTFGRRFAHIPAAISTVASYRFLPNVKISRDGKQTRARRILSIVVNNTPVIAGGTPLTPNAKIDDGQLDVCNIKPAPALELLRLAVMLSLKTPPRSRSIELGRIREMTVTARQPLPIHVDGELVPEIDSKARRMVVKVLPGALRVVMPSLCDIQFKPAAEMAAQSAQNGTQQKTQVPAQVVGHL